MPIIVPSASENFVVPSGYVFFDREDAAGALTGERYIGQTPGFSVQVASPQNVELFSSDGPVEELLESVVTRVTRSASVQTNNVDADNLADFLIANTASASTAAGSVTDEAIGAVKQGRWYQLGVSDTHPAGVRNVTNVVITDDAGTPVTFVAGTDYELDAELARFRVIPGGTIADDTNILADYDTQVSAWDRIVTAATGAVFAAVRLVADNTTGVGRDWYFPRVQLAPDGELALKSREAFQSIGWTMNLLQRQVGGVKRAQMYVDGRAV